MSYRDRDRLNTNSGLTSNKSTVRNNEMISELYRGGGDMNFAKKNRRPFSLLEQNVAESVRATLKNKFLKVMICFS